MEPVYGTVIQAARLVWRLQGLKFTVTGVENLPVHGGAVVAINHTSYFDFTFAGLPAYKQGRGRKVRFMAKKEVFDYKVTGPIMRSLRHIQVDRDSGAASFDEACRKLKEGELVGVYPEATISRSFEIKEFKSGAARMAIAGGRADRPAHRVGRPAHLDEGASQDDVAAQGADLGGRRRADLPDAAARRADVAAAFADAAPAANVCRTPTARTRRRVLGAAPPRRRSAVAGRGQPDGPRRSGREGRATGRQRSGESPG